MFGFTDPGFWPGFWSNFWGNLAADILVAIILVSLLARLGAIFKRPKLVAKMTSVKVGNTEGWRFVRCHVENLGHLNFGPKELYFHIFVRPDIEVDWQTLRSNTLVDARRVEGDTFSDMPDTWAQIQGHVDGNVFPGIDFFLFTVAVRPRVPRLGAGKLEFRFFFNTIYGLLPKRPWTAKLWIRFLHAIHKGDRERTYFGIMTLSIDVQIIKNTALRETKPQRD